MGWPEDLSYHYWAEISPNDTTPPNRRPLPNAPKSVSEGYCPCCEVANHVAAAPVLNWGGTRRKRRQESLFATAMDPGQRAVTRPPLMSRAMATFPVHVIGRQKTWVWVCRRVPATLRGNRFPSFQPSLRLISNVTCFERIFRHHWDRYTAENYQLSRISAMPCWERSPMSCARGEPHGEPVT